MNRIIKSLLSVAIFSTIHCNCKEDDVFTMFFSNKNFVKRVESAAPAKTFRVSTFDGRISSLAHYKNYLFALENFCSEEPSKIWRININNRDDRELVDEESYTCGRKILCMVVAKGFVYAGLKHGYISRCKAKESEECKVLRSFHEDITRIDYNPEDANIYAVSKSNSLLRCSPSFESESCKKIGKFEDNILTAFKVAFNAIWLGVDGTQLWKCPLERIGKNKLKCGMFYEYSVRMAKIKSIAATNKYLYVGADQVEKITRCNIKTEWCEDGIKKPEKSMDQFVLNYED